MIRIQFKNKFDLRIDLRIKERFMSKQTVRNSALALGLLGLALIPSTGLAQVGFASKLPARRGPSAAAHAASSQAMTPAAPSYTYTLLNFPGTYYTYATAINPGATTAKTEIVGGYSAANNPDSGFGFLAHVSGTKTVTESYQAVNFPHEPPSQTAMGVNDSGEIVGTYQDSSGIFHGYELSGGRFTTLNVPFAGAEATYIEGLNNSGEMVGAWMDSATNTHGLTVIGSTYISLDYPGADFTYAEGVNSQGEVVGYYINTTGGVAHGFLLSGGTYTSIDFPGAYSTGSGGINDAGDIVGTYCTISQCGPGGDGVGQAYVLSGGVFTTVAIPGEFDTWVSGINNKGTLVGFYTDPAGLLVSFLATP
jgi:hypothetical protein